MPVKIEELIKHNFIKFIIVVLLAIIICIVGVGLLSNKHINFLGIEFNGDIKEKESENKKDTVFIVQKPTLQSVISDKKTVKFRPSTFPKQTLKDTMPKTSIDAKDNSHVINGNNNQVGVNGDVNYGVQQRHLDQTILDKIISRQPKTSGKINIWFVRDDKESYNYGNEIFQTLWINGYKNIKGTGWFLPGCNDEVKFEMAKDSTLNIKICPVSNVK